MRLDIKNTLCAMIGCIATFWFTSCEEQGLLVNDNSIAYLKFSKDMTKDTTNVSLRMYDTSKLAMIPIEVAVHGQVQNDDLYFNLCVDEKATTLPDHLYVLPSNAECKIRKGFLVDTVYIGLKSDAILDNQTKQLVLQFVETNSVKKGEYIYSRAIFSVTNRLLKPVWWSVLDFFEEDNTVDLFYLGPYSEKKYLMFLDELKKDNVIFDGTNRDVLRKYSLRLKNTIKKMNEGKPKSEWVRDENGIMEIPVAG